MHGLPRAAHVEQRPLGQRPRTVEAYVDLRDLLERLRGDRARCPARAARGHGHRAGPPRARGRTSVDRLTQALEPAHPDGVATEHQHVADPEVPAGSVPVATVPAPRTGDFVALVGPSGCGKSTILKLVSGLLDATSGYVFIAGREVGAQDVRIGMAFQNPTLLPWLTVRQNVMLPLKIVPPFRAQWRDKKKTEFRDRANHLLAKVGLAGIREPFSMAAFGWHAAACFAVPCTHS